MLSRLLRTVWRLGVWSVRAGLALGIVTLATIAPRDERLFPVEGGTRTVWLVDHGYHSGLVLRPADLTGAAAALVAESPDGAEALLWLAGRHAKAAWLEIGWGDRAFYQATPGVADIDPLLALRALFVPTAAVVQIVPLWGDPDMAFGAGNAIQLDLSEEGYLGLVRRLAATLPDKADRTWLGPSLYGTGAFYPAKLDYHLFRTCNHWAAWLLRGAGVPASPIPATLSVTLRWELHWRL